MTTILDLNVDQLQAASINPHIVAQFVEQCVDFVAATMANNLLLRKNLCTLNRAVDIGLNLLHLDQWCHARRFAAAASTRHMRVMRQIVKLLQIPKKIENVPIMVRPAETATALAEARC